MVTKELVLDQNRVVDDVQNKEIAELEKPLRSILKQLHSRIEKNEYGLVIGDDTSGRIPALILWRTLSTLAEKRGQETPKIMFIAGSRYLFGQDRQKKMAALSEFFDKSDIYNTPHSVNNRGLRTLIVTEYIYSGGSLNPITETLTSRNLDFDVASVSADTSRSNMRRLKEKFGVDVFLGQKDMIPSIYREPYLTGVIKSSRELFSRRSELTQRNSINSARKDVDIVTARLVADFTKKRR